MMCSAVAFETSVFSVAFLKTLSSGVRTDSIGVKSSPKFIHNC